MSELKNGCAKIAPLLEPYFEGVLSEAEEQRVAEHLWHCPRCAAELEQVRRLSVLLSRAPAALPTGRPRGGHHGPGGQASRPRACACGRGGGGGSVWRRRCCWPASPVSGTAPTYWARMRSTSPVRCCRYFSGLLHQAQRLVGRPRCGRCGRLAAGGRRGCARGRTGGASPRPPVCSLCRTRTASGHRTDFPIAPQTRSPPCAKLLRQEVLRDEDYVGSFLCSCLLRASRS